MGFSQTQWCTIVKLLPAVLHMCSWEPLTFTKTPHKNKGLGFLAMMRNDKIETILVKFLKYYAQSHVILQDITLKVSVGNRAG